MKRLVLFSAIAVAALAVPALACTGIRLEAKDGAVIVARTLEFGLDIESKVVEIPAGTTLTGTLPNNAKGITYKTKYGFLGANAFGLPVIIDGLNTEGLYIGEFFFPGYAGYADVTPANASQAMAGYEYSDWILGNFATVAEVKANYERSRSPAPSCRRWAPLRPCTSASSTRPAPPSSSSRSAGN